MKILATIHAVISIVACSVFYSMVMHKVLCLFGISDFISDILCSIKEAFIELWHMIAKE